MKGGARIVGALGVLFVIQAARSAFLGSCGGDAQRMLLVRARKAVRQPNIYRTVMASTSTEQESAVAANLATIRERVEAAARTAGFAHTPRLVAVSKTKPVSDLMHAYDAGQRVFGENYVNELVDKAPQMPPDVQWHFIGHLQSNKAKAVASIPNLAMVETVDSQKIADKLSTAAKNAGRAEPLPVLIQVDTSGEDTKSGVDADEVPALAQHILSNCPGLRLAGVMTIGAPDDFGCLDKLVETRANLAKATGLEEASLELSMGMSGDFEEAISRGSTNVRVGSSIFGPRLYPPKK